MNTKKKLLNLLIIACLQLYSCQKEQISDESLKISGQVQAKAPPSGANNELSNWMRTIPDDTNIARLSIPGTHESAAQVDFLISNSAICQNLNIADQLAIGVRFLDIRCRHINNSFAIHHGPIYQKKNFTDILEDCYTFLNQHPSETIIMSVKDEYDAIGNDRYFYKTLESYIQKDPQKWDLSNEVPTLGSIRGKIKLLRRFGPSDLKMGINASNWKDNTTFPITTYPYLQVQDEYVVNSGESKWEAFTRLLKISNEGNLYNRLFINFGSGYNLTNTFGTPNTAAGADYVNPKIKSLFTDGVQGEFGIIPLDFIDVTLSQKIIHTNSLLNTKFSKYKNGWNTNLYYPSPDNDKQYYDIFLPSNRSKEKTRLIIFIHGGSFLGGDKTGGETKQSFNALKDQFPNAAIATINYRVGPFIQMYQHIQDVENAFMELVNKSEEMNISNNQIIIAGESAGAYLALFFGIKGLYYPEKIKAIISYSGFAEMLPEGSLINNALIAKLPSGASFDRDEYSPVAWIPNQKSIPELYLFAGDQDKEISYNCTDRLYNAVKKHPNSRINSKAFKKLYNKEGHTMSEMTKKDIARIIKEKIIYTN